MKEEERELLNKARETIFKYRNISGGMDIIQETMNGVYKYFKSAIPEASFEDERILAVFKLELLLENVFLPLKSEPIFDVENPPVIPDVINSEEDCKRMVECIVYQTRANLNERDDVKTSNLAKKCIDASYVVGKICEQLGVSQRRFQCSENLDYAVFHCFNVVDFELPSGEMKMYLVDCTYRQFFTYAFNFLERIGMPLNSGADIGCYMMMDDSRKRMAEELLTKGYVEFSPQNIKHYFDGFVFSGRNGLYYEQLGKSVLEKSDYEPNYTYIDYLHALNNRGLKNEPYIGRQLGVLSSPITFDCVNVNTNANVNNK